LHAGFDLEYCREQSFILLYRLLFVAVQSLRMEERPEFVR
jgi:hypothetical protein